jgi:8-oxo-dGTP diphosphatase
VTTKTSDPGVPPDYDPSQFPPFAVTVDVVVLTVSDGRLHVLLVRRGVPPFEGMWAIPGGFKRPAETLDEAAERELVEETGVHGRSVLRQFGAYGDPGRDPRMNVVTVAYLAVHREVRDVVGGADATDAALFPVSDVVNGKMELAFDHTRIVRDAVERFRVDLVRTGLDLCQVVGRKWPFEGKVVVESFFDRRSDRELGRWKHLFDRLGHDMRAAVAIYLFAFRTVERNRF